MLSYNHLSIFFLKKEFDLFTTLDVMDNSSFLEKLKFHRGDRNLHYYLYNWKCPSTYPHKVTYYYIIVVFIVFISFSVLYDTNHNI